jgi:hypothetical protein
MRINVISKRLFFIALIILCIFTNQVASLPTIIFPLKPSPAIGPYQDDDFLHQSNNTIYELSNATIPNGTNLRELQTTQQKLSKMNVSPELYPTAKQINAYLYYVTKAGDAADDSMTLADKPYSPESTDWTINSDVTTYQNASLTIWNQIKDLYPNATTYKLRPIALPLRSDKVVTSWPKSPFSEFDSNFNSSTE